MVPEVLCPCVYGSDPSQMHIPAMVDQETLVARSFGSLLSSFVVWRGGLSCREAPQLLGESCTSGGPSKKTVKCINFTCLSRVLHKNRFHPDLIQGHFHSIGLENRLEIKGCSG